MVLMVEVNDGTIGDGFDLEVELVRSVVQGKVDDRWGSLLLVGEF